MSALSDLLARLRALVFRRREERELAEEMRFHVEMETEYRRRSGVSEDEARRQVQRHRTGHRDVVEGAVHR